jgi:hypothetical protein
MAIYDETNTDPQCEGPKLVIPHALKEQALNAYRDAMEAKGRGLAGGTSCPNCGYCPSCGRSNTNYIFPTNVPVPGQVWCSTTGPKC